MLLNLLTRSRAELTLIISSFSMTLVAKQYCRPLLSRIVENSALIRDFQRFEEDWTRRRFSVPVRSAVEVPSLSMMYKSNSIQSSIIGLFGLDVMVIAKAMPVVLGWSEPHEHGPRHGKCKARSW
jgi:hypothetical protein